MKRRPLLWSVVLLSGAFVVWWLCAPRQNPDAAPAAVPEVRETPQVVTTRPASPSIPPPPAPTATQPSIVVPPVPPQASAYTAEQRGETVQAEALQEVEQVQGMLRDFRTVFGENPVGTNAEIMAALNGGNAKQVRLGPSDGQGLNGKGELVDRWGTPYFFHQVDGRHMEVHSAGADKIMGTADDVVMR